ncbi:MAG TPA: hypothetical protein VM286_07385 [Candidatus Thermoplasmatota archaeon]|nr:hypothetical protein [Candidatus Thermoplasmatota archaeon]
MADAELNKRLVKILNELEERFAQGTIPLKEMTAYVEQQKIPHLDGYLRRAGALDYQSPKRFFQAGPDLKGVREALKKNKVPRGLEGLLGAAS